MGLFGFGKKKQPSMPVQKSSVSIFEEDLTRLTPDGELPFGWYYANKEFTERITGEYRHFLDAYVATRHDIVLNRYSALKSLVLYIEDVHNLCASKDECFAAWANVHIADAEQLSEYKTEMQYIEQNIDELIQKEQTIAKLKVDLLAIIESEPGVVQSDLYKRFEPDLKNTISNELYQMEVHDAIIREKAGRSYKLFIK